MFVVFASVQSYPPIGQPYLTRITQGPPQNWHSHFRLIYDVITILKIQFDQYQYHRATMVILMQYIILYTGWLIRFQVCLVRIDGYMLSTFFRIRDPTVIFR